MLKKYFEQYESPNIVIVPTAILTKKNSINTTAVAAKTEPSTNDSKYAKVLSETLDNSFVNNDQNMSINVLDSVEETLQQLHNVPTSLAEFSSRHDATIVSNSKYSSHNNLIDLTNTNHIKIDGITPKLVDNLNNREIRNQVIEHISLKANEKHVSDLVNSDIKVQSVSKLRPQDDVDSITHSTATVNEKKNEYPTLTSYETENKVNRINDVQELKKDSRSIINQTETKNSHSKFSCKKNRNRHNCNNKDEIKSCLGQPELLRVKSKSIKQDEKHCESTSKYKLKSDLKKEEYKYGNIEPNNEVLKYTSLSRKQNHDMTTSGALKRYLEYQRFLAKYYHNTFHSKKHDLNNEEKACVRDPNLNEERKTHLLKRIKGKGESVNITSIMEHNKKEEKFAVKSSVERAKKGQESQKKRNSYSDKKRSHKQSTDSNERKKSKEGRNEKPSIDNVKKKEEIKIKLSSYVTSKKNEKSNERRVKHSKKVEMNRKFTNCSDKTEHTKDGKNVSLKRKFQEEECNGKSTNNSKRKKMKEDANKKTYKIKELGIKRKNTDSRQKETKRPRKTESCTIINSSSKRSEEKIPTPVRTVDVIKETSCHNLPSSCVSKIDLRSKISRKRTLNQCNKDIDHIRSSTARENLVVTVKQNVQDKTSANSQTASKPKLKKSKNIKLVINIKCSNSNDSDDVANESENEIPSENTSPHQDFSFLDEIDIDEIVDSLNANQRTQSPNCESHICAEEHFNDATMARNKSDLSVEALKNVCHYETLHHPNFQLNNKESNMGFINKMVNQQVLATETDTKLKEYNDDVFEVIDITDDVEKNIVSVDDDTNLVPMDANAEQSRVSNTNSRNNSGVHLAKPKEIVPKIAIIHISDDSRDSTDVINIKNAEDNKIGTAKNAIAQAASLDVATNIENKIVTKDAIQENLNMHPSNVTINPTKEKEINIKSEYTKESEISVPLDYIPIGVDKINIKKESQDAGIHLSINIKKETHNESIHSSLDIKNEGFTPIVPSTNIKIETPNELILPSISLKEETQNKAIHISTIIKSENVRVHTPVQSKIDSKDDTATSTEGINVQNETINKSANTIMSLSQPENVRVHTPVQSNIDSKDDIATSTEEINVQNETKNKSKTTIMSLSQPENVRVHTPVHSNIDLKDDNATSTEENNVQNETKNKSENTIISLSQSENIRVHTAIQSNINSKDDTATSTEEINVQNGTRNKPENISVHTAVQSNINSKDDTATSAEEINVQNGTRNKLENISVHTDVQSNIDSKDDTANSTEDINVQNETKNKSEDTIMSCSQPDNHSKKQIINDTSVMSKEFLVDKDIKVDKTPEINSENKTGRYLSEAYKNTMEKLLLKVLHKKYSILENIHSGYFSNIYKCKDPNGGLYAIKVFKSRFQNMTIYKDRILMDLQKNVNKDAYFNLKIISTFNIGRKLCLLTEYYPKTLAQVLANKKSLHIDVVQTLSRQLVSAVETITCNNIVHTDIKPDHILLNNTNDKLKLCGFDRADYNHHLKIKPSSSTSSYRAPEIILGFDADFKIDVWATALVMYEMASGMKLFPGRYNNEILYKQICTLGPIYNRMLENSTYVHLYFYGGTFIRRMGEEEISYIGKFPPKNNKLRSGPHTANKKYWAPHRTPQQISEDLHKVEMLHKLLEQMLVIYPHCRLPITDVATNEFFFIN